MEKPILGCIGQGYIGKNYADDFERRGYVAIRYALEKPYVKNKERIQECDIVFVAVPTPTTPVGFDDSVVRVALGLVGKGKVAVIKSTVLPGTTKKLQQDFPDIFITMSPEFLREVSAAHDAAHPFSNIVGIPEDSPKYHAVAEQVHAVLPRALYTLTCDSTEAEVIKYAHNASGYTQIILFNLIYDLAQKLQCDWSTIESALEADPLISNTYAHPVHKNGRGAGGHCFIKDLAALRGLYKQYVGGGAGLAVFEALEAKNKELLQESNKDLDLLKGVYGAE